MEIRTRVKPVVKPPVGLEGPYTNKIRYIKNHFLRNLRKESFAIPFLDSIKVVDPNDSATYTIVDDPMDLETISQRVNNRYYHSVDYLIYDLKLILSNCYTYNHRHSTLYRMGRQMEKLLYRAIKKLPKGTEKPYIKKRSSVVEEVAEKEAHEVEEVKPDKEAVNDKVKQKQLKLRLKIEKLKAKLLAKQFEEQLEEEQLEEEQLEEEQSEEEQLEEEQSEEEQSEEEQTEEEQLDEEQSEEEQLEEEQSEEEQLEEEQLEEEQSEEEQTEEEQTEEEQSEEEQSEEEVFRNDENARFDVQEWFTAEELRYVQYWSSRIELPMNEEGIEEEEEINVEGNKQVDQIQKIKEQQELEGQQDVAQMVRGANEDVEEWEEVEEEESEDGEGLADGEEPEEAVAAEANGEAAVQEDDTEREDGVEAEMGIDMQAEVDGEEEEEVDEEQEMGVEEYYVGVMEGAEPQPEPQLQEAEGAVLKNEVQVEEGGELQQIAAVEDQYEKKVVAMGDAVANVKEVNVDDSITAQTLASQNEETDVTDEEDLAEYEQYKLWMAKCQEDAEKSVENTAEQVITDEHEQMGDQQDIPQDQLQQEETEAQAYSPELLEEGEQMNSLPNVSLQERYALQKQFNELPTDAKVEIMQLIERCEYGSRSNANHKYNVMFFSPTTISLMKTAMDRANWLNSRLKEYSERRRHKRKLELEEESDLQCNDPKKFKQDQDEDGGDRSNGEPEV